MYILYRISIMVIRAIQIRLYVLGVGDFPTLITINDLQIWFIVEALH